MYIYNIVVVHGHFEFLYIKYLYLLYEIHNQNEIAFLHFFIKYMYICMYLIMDYYFLVKDMGVNYFNLKFIYIFFYEYCVQYPVQEIVLATNVFGVYKAIRVYIYLKGKHYLHTCTYVYIVKKE